MWQSSLITVATVKSSFEAFLETPEFDQALRRAEKQSPHPPCLLDIVGIWLGYGDNILQVETFELLLISIIGMAEDWQSSGRTSIGGMPLWPDPETGEGREVPRFSWPIDDSVVESAPEVDLSIDLSLGVIHSVLVRANFDAQRERALQLHRDRIEAKLDQVIKQQSEEWRHHNRDHH